MLWPQRCTALISVRGYLIGSQKAGKVPLSPEAELQWWDQYYFATEGGRVGYDKNRRDFAKRIRGRLRSGAPIDAGLWLFRQVARHGLES